MKTLVALLLSAGCLNAQVVNAASGSSFVAPGSLVSIYAGLTKASGSATSLPLPTSLSNQFYLLFNWTPQIVANLAGNTANRVPLLYWSPAQINAALPNSVSLGTGSLAAISLAGSGPITSTTVGMNVAAQAPGIFLYQDGSVSRGILTDAAGSLISSANPLRPRQTFVIWLTGLGVQPVAPQMLLSNGSHGAVFYAGHTSFAGLDQVNVTLPGWQDLTASCAVGSRLEVGMALKSTTTGIQSNSVSLPILIDSCN